MTVKLCLIDPKIFARGSETNAWKIWAQYRKVPATREEIKQHNNGHLSVRNYFGVAASKNLNDLLKNGESKDWHRRPTTQKVNDLNINKSNSKEKGSKEKDSKEKDSKEKDSEEKELENTNSNESSNCVMFLILLIVFGFFFFAYLFNF